MPEEIEGQQARESVWAKIGRDFRFFRECCDDRAVIALTSYGLPAIALFRFGHAAGNINRPIFRWPLLLVYHLLRIPVELILGISIARTAAIAVPLMIHHHGQIFIAAGCTIGARCQIFQGVTIGESGGARPGRPVIGDEVVVGAGAKILGAVHVGDAARVGANSVVVRDVPPRGTAVGVPARIVEREQ